MRQRCNNPNSEGYKNYGGRGIRVCDKWDSYEAFLSDMGERPDGTSIDRVDVNGDYCPENCRWASPSDQARNRRNNVTVEIYSVNLAIHEIAAKYGIPEAKIRRRIAEGKPMDEVLSTGSLLIDRRGEKCPASKLTEGDVVEIKRRLSSGETCASIARHFGRSYMCIKDIHKGKNWSHVPWPIEVENVDCD